jgi:hypothetical protein
VVPLAFPSKMAPSKRPLRRCRLCFRGTVGWQVRGIWGRKVLYATVLLFCTLILYSIILYCTPLFCTALRYSVLRYSVLRYSVRNSVLYSIILYCTPLFCTVFRYPFFVLPSTQHGPELYNLTFALEDFCVQCASNCIVSSL